MDPSLQGVSFTSSSQIMRYKEIYFAPKLFVVSEADLDILILCVYLVKMALALALTACSDSLLWLLAAILFWYLLRISLFSDMSPSQAFLYFEFSHLFHPTDCGDSIEITRSQLNISMSVSFIVRIIIIYSSVLSGFCLKKFHLQSHRGVEIYTSGVGFH